MGKLVIGKPYILEKGSQIKLCANININEEKHVLYYEIDKIYKEYLCSERSDAFLISLIQYAMANNLNIIWNTPVTERLEYQLRTIFIPVISERFQDLFHSISLSGPVISEPVHKKLHAVGTGASGGVDSFYSVIKHLEIPEKSFELTHLFYAAISNDVTSEENLREDFEDSYAITKAIAQDLGFPVIKLFSNESEYYFKGIINWGAMRFAGMIYALQRLFSTYYFSSGYPYVDITFGHKEKGINFDAHHFDLFTLMVVSTENITFIGTGGEIKRSEKLKIIEKSKIVKKHLFVCNYNKNKNCSSCDKCLRTMMQLYTDGCLEEYRDVFDLDKFQRAQNRYIRKMLYRQSIYDIEIIQSMKANQVKIPVYLKISAFFIRPVYVIWQKIKDIKWIMTIFYQFHFDYFLYGKKMANSLRYAKGIPRKK
ncbi:hypothetical protein AALB16_07965 [Lachnospiraceae bacterium 62-35]